MRALKSVEANLTGFLGSPEIGLSLDQLKVEVEDSMPSPQLRNMEETRKIFIILVKKNKISWFSAPPTRRSTSKMDDLIGDVKPPGRIRATSYSVFHYLFFNLANLNQI